jgi:hypothetical protein
MPHCANVRHDDHPIMPRQVIIVVAMTRVLATGLHLIRQVK